MSRIAVIACAALCGCVGSMVPAPRHIPSDGVVECTDSVKTPLALAAIGAASIGVSLYAARYHAEGAIESGGVMWVPLLAGFGVAALAAAAEGGLSVASCRAAKRRGAEVAEAAREKAIARAEAGTEWKRAAAAARADDCATVRELDPQVRALDLEFHDVVFLRDVAIARCLAGAREPAVTP